jgi:hypothetical protein
MPFGRKRGRASDQLALKAYKCYGMSIEVLQGDQQALEAFLSALNGFFSDHHHLKSTVKTRRVDHKPEPV